MNPQKARRVALACAVLAAAVTASAQNPAPTPSTSASGAAGGGDKPYKGVDGFYVDDFTLQGFHTWRAAACDRCHGANQQGLVGPSLLESFKTLSKETFVKTITEGRLEKGMPSFSTSPTVMEHKDELYAYLKGRSNGDITRAKVEELK